MRNSHAPELSFHFKVRPPGNGDVVVDKLLPDPAFDGLEKAVMKANAGTGHSDFLEVVEVNGLFSGTDGGLLDL